MDTHNPPAIPEIVYQGQRYRYVALIEEGAVILSNYLHQWVRVGSANLRGKPDRRRVMTTSAAATSSWTTTATCAWRRRRELMAASWAIGDARRWKKFVERDLSYQVLVHSAICRIRRTGTATPPRAISMITHLRTVPLSGADHHQGRLPVALLRR